MKVLVVEDDPVVLETVTEALQQENFEVHQARNGSDGEWLAEQDTYDLILLDIMLPGQDGLTITKHLRSRIADIPIILVTAKDAVTDRVHGLDVGADDYIVKPFALAELLARIRAVLRRRGNLGLTGALHYGALRLDPRSHLAWVNDRPLSLTTKEYELLEFFVSNPERILTREQIFDRVWGFDSDSGDTIVDVYVHYLRRKLAGEHCHTVIITQRGVGFMLKEP